MPREIYTRLCVHAEPHAQEGPGSSCTIEGVPIYQIEEILELLEASQDVLNFASGLLARRPGGAAVAMANSGGEANEGPKLGSEVKSGLLERLLTLSTEFGEVDEVLDISNYSTLLLEL